MKKIDLIKWCAVAPTYISPKNTTQGGEVFGEKPAVWSRAFYSKCNDGVQVGPSKAMCCTPTIVCLSTIKTRDTLWVPATLSQRGGTGGGPCPWENKHNVSIWGGDIVLVNRSVNKENMFPPHLTLLLSGSWDKRHWEGHAAALRSGKETNELK